jgi:multimeric flavodoxin WrbA
VSVRAVCLNGTLKRSPEPSNTSGLASVVLDALEDEGVETKEIRLADHTIEPGVVSEAVTDADEWPAIRAKILKAEILVIATPTWLGQPSSVIKRALERMDAFLSEIGDDGTPVAYNRVAGCSRSDTALRSDAIHSGAAWTGTSGFAMPSMTGFVIP